MFYEVLPSGFASVHTRIGRQSFAGLFFPFRYYLQETTSLTEDISDSSKGGCIINTLAYIYIYVIMAVATSSYQVSILSMSFKVFSAHFLPSSVRQSLNM